MTGFAKSEVCLYAPVGLVPLTQLFLLLHNYHFVLLNLHVLTGFLTTLPVSSGFSASLGMPVAVSCEVQACLVTPVTVCLLGEAGKHAHPSV